MFEHLGAMKSKSPRLAVRALILDEDRLLIVNAYAGQKSDLWCAPGGGVEAGASLTQNLAREVEEELGAKIEVGQPCLINEFHDPRTGFHQVEVFFRCKMVEGPKEGWRDAEGVVNRHRFVTRNELATLRHKPDSLAATAWGIGPLYDPLEVIVL